MQNIKCQGEKRERPKQCAELFGWTLAIVHVSRHHPNSRAEARLLSETKVVQHRAQCLKLAWFREWSVERLSCVPAIRPLTMTQQCSLSLCTAGNDAQCNIPSQAEIHSAHCICRTRWQTIATSDAHFTLLSCPNFKRIVLKFKNAQSSNLSSFVPLSSSIRFEMPSWTQIDASKNQWRGKVSTILIFLGHFTI